MATNLAPRKGKRLKESGHPTEVEGLNPNLSAPDTKVFIYTPRGKGIAHLYQQTSSGKRLPLCRRPIDNMVPASQIVRLREGICGTCTREAKKILSANVAQESK